VKEFDGGRKGGGDGGRRSPFSREEMEESVRHCSTLSLEDGGEVGGCSRELAYKEAGHSRGKEDHEG